MFITLLKMKLSFFFDSSKPAILFDKFYLCIKMVKQIVDQVLAIEFAGTPDSVFIIHYDLFEGSPRRET